MFKNVSLNRSHILQQVHWLARHFPVVCSPPVVWYDLSIVCRCIIIPPLNWRSYPRQKLLVHVLLIRYHVFFLLKDLFWHGFCRIINTEYLTLFVSTTSIHVTPRLAATVYYFLILYKSNFVIQAFAFQTLDLMYLDLSIIGYNLVALD